MKTQVDKFESEQALNNKMMLLSLLAFGCILFIVSVTKLLQNTYSFSENSLGYLNQTPANMGLVVMYSENSNEDSDMPEFNFLPSINAELTVKNRQTLETDKLNEKLFENRQKAYQDMLYTLRDIEEPELFIEDILSQIKVQTKTMEYPADQVKSVNPNVYLNGLYKQKTDDIWDKIDKQKDIEELLALENESDLELESWMTECHYWKLTTKESNEFEQSLAQSLAHKNAEVFAVLESERISSQYAAIDTEEPLQVESWMTGTVDNMKVQKISENTYLTEMLASKNAEIYEITDLLWKVKCCMVIEKEEPLVIENWMIDTKCWCPNKKRTEHRYNESFALNDDNK